MRKAVLQMVMLAGAAAITSGAAQAQVAQADDAYYKAMATRMQEIMARQPNTGRAKNVILFVGDGMGVATVTASRIYAGQKAGEDGVSHQLTFETFPYGALSRTYSHDSQVTDSAPSAVAMTAGVKSRNDVLGLTADVALGDCPAALTHAVTTIAELAEQAGMSTGAVSTARITHATPAANYAHSAHRDWEADSDMPAPAIQGGCVDIARQLVEWKFGDGMEVAMGGGRAYFLPTSTVDPEYADKKGRRKDGKDLTQAWIQRYANGGAYVIDQAGFDKLDPANVDHVLGLFEPSHMQYEADRAKDKGGEPSLAAMTVKAIDILKKNPQGFYLMVEGGRIDHAHHAGNAARALEDAVAFDVAVAAAIKATDPAETLIIVTADHSHAFSLVGYPKRDNPILGISIGVDGKPILGTDGKPYTTLAYANGPGGSKEAKERPDLTDIDTADIDYIQQALVPMASETHAGEDVAIYATGPWAHLFQGTVDENYTFHVMNYATGLSERAKSR